MCDVRATWAKGANYLGFWGLLTGGLIVYFIHFFILLFNRSKRQSLKWKKEIDYFI